MNKKNSGIYRNLTAYGDRDFSRYLRRAFLASAGYDDQDLDRPVIGIADTRSDYNTCHRQMPEMVAAVKRGILEAGGLPMAFPTISLNEILTSPTTMLYRNLAAMDTEEMITAQPMDGVVLLGGCDKTLPAQVMASVSADIPAIHVVTGPMLTGHWRGERLGACTDCRRLWTEYRAGTLSDTEIKEIEQNLCATGGTCMVMGTASTMACLVETLGLMLPFGATPPHATGQRLKTSTASGRRIVGMVKEDLTPMKILTPGSFQNAAAVLMALGGSTNAVIHLLAIARRAGIGLTLEEISRIGKKVPVLVDCKPAGSNYMEDFHHAGGMPALLREMAPLLDLGAGSVTGKRLGALVSEAGPAAGTQSIIRSLSRPLKPEGAITALFGTLAPDGAVLKTAAASAHLMKHTGPAIVFESAEDAAGRIDDPSLNITPDHVMLLRNCGPVGAGMPEAGSLPIPRYLARQGVRDMVRVSDGRMSGTAYGTVILHCAPESAVGGPLSLVQDGDMVALDVEKGRIDLQVPAEILEKRKSSLVLPPLPPRGWKRLYASCVNQADQGCDLDFMTGDQR